MDGRKAGKLHDVVKLKSFDGNTGKPSPDESNRRRRRHSRRT